MQRAGPRLDREQLLDRFHSHTEHCAACSGALRNVERALQLSLWAGYLLAFASAVCAATALSGGTVPSTLGGCTVGQGGAIGAAGRILLSLAVRSLPAGRCSICCIRIAYRQSSCCVTHLVKAVKPYVSERMLMAGFNAHRRPRHADGVLSGVGGGSHRGCSLARSVIPPEAAILRGDVAAAAKQSQKLMRSSNTILLCAC